MTPLETALKLASASATCERHKCPFITKCKGDYTTCAMKEVALILRQQNAEIESLTAKCDAYEKMLAATHQYIIDIEKVNKRYHDLCIAFEHGYRPKKVKRLKRAPKPKKDVTLMDGDKRYEYVPPKDPDKEAPPLVII